MTLSTRWKALACALWVLLLASAASAQTAPDGVATAIAAGNAHTCALFASGVARCWGSNSHGELGDGTRADRFEASAALALTGIAQLSSGNQHTCARMIDGTVQCWGRNDFGQLGDGSTRDRALPAMVPALAQVVEVGAGDSFTCARLHNGHVACWGSNRSGELAQRPPPASQGMPRMVRGLSHATLLAVGGSTACVVRGDREVVCWGRDYHVDDEGSPGHPFVPSGRLRRVRLPGRPMRISVGASTACAALADGSVWCWGMHRGVFTAPNTTDPTAIPGLRDVVEVGCGSAFSCAIQTDGGTWCWGESIMGRGGTMTAHEPRRIVTLRGAALAVGDAHACVRTSAGVIDCWGNNTHGALGDGTATSSWEPHALVFDALPPAGPVGAPPVGFEAVSIAASHAWACAATRSGAVWCWGRNEQTAAAMPDAGDRRTPTRVFGIEGATQVALAMYHACALTRGGRVWCWGMNGQGELGDGTTDQRAIPVSVVGLDDAVEVAVGQNQSCARRGDGTVRCWGAGVGSVATPVPGLTQVVQLAMTYDHACARITDGTVQCWGANSFGQLDDGDRADRGAPRTLAGIEHVAEVVLGHGETCVRVEAGGLSCRGRWSFGPQSVQSPVGDRGGWWTPRGFADLRGISCGDGMTHGDDVACGVGAGGFVRCGGSNTYGGLGDGTTVPREGPVPVLGLTSVAQVAAGNGFACARLESGAVACWGDNERGQLGTGDARPRRAPTPVRWSDVER